MGIQEILQVQNAVSYTHLDVYKRQFLGLESACANSDAVENPEKNVPIAVLGGTLGAAVIYIVDVYKRQMFSLCFLPWLSTTSLV